MHTISWLVTCACLPSLALADLPKLNGKDEWAECFAVHRGQRYSICLLANGELWMIPRQRGREPVSASNRIRIQYGIEESLPDGSTILKKIYPLTLTCDQPASREINQLHITGEATGNSKFEIHIEQSLDVISLGGRILDPGKLTTNPIRFTYRVIIPNVYRNVETDDKASQRDFKRNTRGDFLELTRISGETSKVETSDSTKLLESDLVNHAYQSLKLKLSYYDGRTFLLQANEHSSITLSDGGYPKPWFAGFIAHWWADAQKDPQGNTRLSISVK